MDNFVNYLLNKKKPLSLSSAKRYKNSVIRVYRDLGLDIATSPDQASEHLALWLSDNFALNKKGNRQWSASMSNYIKFLGEN
tara:strand:+ start:256 stop:501 length:246 start_codon:yes stop_codon:yes gene_type:complete